MTNPEKVSDPVCGMSFYVDKAAAHADRDGRTYYFCTQACKRQFDADPGRFVQSAKATS